MTNNSETRMTCEYVEISTDVVTVDQVLRTFDSLRRRLALRATGREGAAAGYSRLWWNELPTERGRFGAEAAELERGDRWQRVEYRAVFHPEVGDVSRVLAVGVAQTVGLGVLSRKFDDSGCA